jgi:hypothetical protein
MSTSEHASFSVVKVPQLVVLDFDRMLASDETSNERIYAAAVEFNVDVAALDKAREGIEQDGGSFEPLTTIQGLVAPDTFRAIVERFKTEDAYPLLYPDASPFVDRLDAAGVPHMVLTYGVSPAWQELKVTSSGYDGSFVVMEHSDKGERIASWRNEAGKYVFEDADKGVRYEADFVCLLDDKAKAFKSLPSDCTGYWVKRSEILKPSQQGTVPTHVEGIYGLTELVVQDKRLVRFQVQA